MQTQEKGDLLTGCAFHAQVWRLHTRVVCLGGGTEVLLFFIDQKYISNGFLWAPWEINKL